MANPQATIAKFNPSHVMKFREGCFRGEELEKTGITFALVPLYKDSFPNWVAYLQNEDDSLHIEHHLPPWQEAVKVHPERYGILYGDWGDGHAPVLLYLLMGILVFAVSLNGDWKTFLSDPMFTH